jgi:hypothetical protein
MHLDPVVLSRVPGLSPGTSGCGIPPIWRFLVRQAGLPTR